MTRVARNRSKPAYQTGVGSFRLMWVGTPTPNMNYAGPYDTSMETCDDHYGAPWTDSPLLITKGRSPVPQLTGKTAGYPLSYEIEDPVPMALTSLRGVFAPFSWAGLPPRRSLGQLTAEAKANMNPNSPVIDLPVSILELREIPQLLHDAGRIAIKIRNKRKLNVTLRNAAKANVVAQFGIMPIIRDVLTLIGFTKAVADREKYLLNLYNGPTTVRRRLGKDVFNYGREYTPAWPSQLCTSIPANRLVCTHTLTREYWFSARARLTDPVSVRDLHTAAFTAVLGGGPVTSDALWQLLPWSWLIDYFSTFGDILAANRGGLRWSYEALNLMCHSQIKTDGYFPPSPFPDIVNPPGPKNVIAHEKWRGQGSLFLFPELKIPYLSWAQISILSSLFVIKV